MTNEQAVFLREFMLPSIEMEFGATTKVIAAVPDGEAADYRPDPKSRPANELAWHIVESELQFFNAIANMRFDFSDSGPNPTATSAELVALYNDGFRKGVERIREMTPEQLATPVDFLGVFNLPAVSYLTLLSNHTIHHRGQLSSYLRAMGARVPAIYGPSADET